VQLLCSQNSRVFHDLEYYFLVKYYEMLTAGNLGYRGLEFRKPVLDVSYIEVAQEFFLRR